MKCANCGAEIRVGCVYCPVCGKEAQIVSDYNILEDDYLDSLLQEECYSCHIHDSTSKIICFSHYNKQVKYLL